VVASKLSFLLNQGNTKLGRSIFTFSLPAVVTCPGRSTLCSKACYALRGEKRFPSLKASYKKRYTASKQANFTAKMIQEIQLLECDIVRIHVSGDFYSPNYVARWIEIARSCPGTKFYAYTRSWRDPAILRELQKLAKVKNVRLWFSCDAETGLPRTRMSSRIRVAWMLSSPDEVLPSSPSVRADLVFRVHRSTVSKKTQGTLVCPSENGVSTKKNGSVTCEKCGLCWDDLNRKDSRRFLLPLI